MITVMQHDPAPIAAVPIQQEMQRHNLLGRYAIFWMP
jgi:hypothetical protein